MRRAAGWLLVLAVLAAAYFHGRDYVRRHPQDVPWTELRLDQPVGLFTRRKLAGLSERPGQCRALLSQAGAADVAVPPRPAEPGCGYVNGMRLGQGAGEAAFAPAGVVTSCPVAAALVLFERQVVQPAALRHFGSGVAVVTNAGSYSCRRLYGRTEGEFSEHATADAVDITGFVLADGTRISVLADWRTAGPEGAFLDDVRDGACRLFATTLSPDYNAAHADHLHLDMGARRNGRFGVCR